MFKFGISFFLGTTAKIGSLSPLAVAVYKHESLTLSLPEVLIKTLLAPLK